MEAKEKPEHILPLAKELQTMFLKKTGQDEASKQNDDKKKKKDKPLAGKLRKIRLFPTKKQKEILNVWFKTTS